MAAKTARRHPAKQISMRLMQNFDLCEFIFSDHAQGSPRLPYEKVKRELDQRLPPVLTYVDHFAAPVEPGGPAAALVEACASPRARNRMEEAALAFLRFEDLEAPSIQEPGAFRPITAECHFGRHHAMFFVDAGRPSIMVALARTLLFSIDLSTKTVTFLSRYREQTFTILRSLLATLYRRGVAYEDVFSPPPPGAGRALVIGDERPTHFLRQSMGFLEARHDEVLSFLKSGGELWVVRDQAFVDPADIFPDLRAGKIVYTTVAEAFAAFDWGPRFMHRVYRHTIDSMSWARGGFLGERPREENAASRPLRLFVSIDAEKSRFLNQVECLSAVLARFAEAYGDFEVVWDGWTLKPSAIDARDREMLGRIRETVALIEKPAALKAETAAYETPLGEKLAQIAACDLAICPHGTAALLPSRGYSIPTVTYHVRACMQGLLEVDKKAFFPVEAAYIEEYAEQEGWLVDRRHFKVDPVGVLKAIDRGLSGRPKVSA